MSIENLFIWIAVFFSIISFVIGLVSVIKNTSALKKVSYRSYVATLFFILLSIIFLFYRLITKDFSYDYVVSHTLASDNIFTSMLSLFNGREGVFLSFVAIYALISLCMLFNKYIFSIRAAYVLSSSSIIFILLLCIALYSNPFTQTFPAVTEGISIDSFIIKLPLLLNFITMFCGYAFVATTFSFVTAYALNGRKNHLCFSDTVFKLSLLSMLFLTISNGLNMYWSYKTVDLGGYWSWTLTESLSLVSWIFSGIIVHTAFLLKKSKDFSIYNSFSYFFAFISVLFCFFQAEGFFPFVVSGDHLNLSILMYAVPFFFVSHLTIMSFSAVVSQKIEFDTIKGGHLSDIHIVSILFITSFAICAGVILPFISRLWGDVIVVSASYYKTTLMVLSAYFLFLSYLDTREPWLQRVKSFKYYLFDWWAIIMAVGAMGMVFFKTYNFTTSMVIGLAFLNVFKFFAVYLSTIIRLKLKGMPFGLSVLSVFVDYPYLYTKYLLRVGLSVFCIGIILSTSFMNEKNFVVSKTEKSSIGKYYLKFSGVSTNKLNTGFKKEAKIILESSGENIEFFPHKVYKNINSSPVNIADRKSVGKYDVFISFLGYENGVMTGMIKMVPYVKIIWSGLYLVVFSLLLMFFNKRKVIYL